MTVRTAGQKSLQIIKELFQNSSLKSPSMEEDHCNPPQNRSAERSFGRMKGKLPTNTHGKVRKAATRSLELTDIAK